MRREMLLLVCLFTSMGWGQNQGHFEQKINAGKILNMKLSAGNYTILPGAPDGVAVTYFTKKPEELEQVKVRFISERSQNSLEIKGPKDDFGVMISVPVENDLHVRLTAGELRVEK